MSKKAELNAAIKNLLKGKQKMFCVWATCKSVDVANTSCTITLDDLDIENIDLGTSLSGVILYPTVGKDVLVLFVDHSLTGRVIDAEQTDNIELMGNTNGGIPIAQQILDNLNAIKDYLTTEKGAIASGLTAVGIGSAANGTTGAAAYNSAMAAAAITFYNMENSKVKHGNG